MKEQEQTYLACERRYVFELLMAAAGMMGAYTLVLRGGVFCNAQTANFALMAVALGQGNWLQGVYYLIPITAYLLGTMLSEWLPGKVVRWRLLRWDTYLIGFEVLVLFCVGWVPLTLPHQIVQVAINFICSMQYNTFRQAEKVPMATTFCTNHLRQTGVFLVKFLKTRDPAMGQRMLRHFSMIFCFALGAMVQTVACGLWAEKAIWLAMVPLLINFVILASADLGREHELLERVPSGH